MDSSESFVEVLPCTTSADDTSTAVIGAFRFRRVDNASESGSSDLAYIMYSVMKGGLSLSLTPTSMTTSGTVPGAGSRRATDAQSRQECPGRHYGDRGTALYRLACLCPAHRTCSLGMSAARLPRNLDPNPSPHAHNILAALRRYGGWWGSGFCGPGPRVCRFVDHRRSWRAAGMPTCIGGPVFTERTGVGLDVHARSAAAAGSTPSPARSGGRQSRWGGGLMSGVVGVLVRVRRGPAGTMGSA